MLWDGCFLAGVSLYRHHPLCVLTWQAAITMLLWEPGSCPSPECVVKAGLFSFSPPRVSSLRSRGKPGSSGLSAGLGVLHGVPLAAGPTQHPFPHPTLRPGVRMLDGEVTDAVEARSLGLNPNHIHIAPALISDSRP